MKEAKMKRSSVWWIIPCITVVMAVVLILVVILRSKQQSGEKNFEYVVEVMKNKGTENGYENALSELTPLRSTVVEGDTYYRLQQNFQGIPVYGRSVVYVSNKKGDPISITHNVQDIPNELNLNPTVTLEHVQQKILENMFVEYADEETLELLEDAFNEATLYIYDLDGEARLVYQICVGGYCLLVDAHSGEVVHSMEMMRSISVKGELGHNNENFNVLKLDDSAYAFKDTDYRIYVYDANKKVYYNTSNNQFSPNNITLVTSPDHVFGDDNDSEADSIVGAELLSVIKDIRCNYFASLGDPGGSTAMLLVYDDDHGNEGANAAAGMMIASGYDPKLFPDGDIANGDMISILTVGYDYSDNINEYIDMLAHEYAHIVSYNEVKWTADSVENNGLNEAFSDVFGILYEAYVRGTDPVWFMHDRNILDPHLCSYPKNISDLSSQTQSAYRWSTVISHTAYLMWNGIDENPSKMISAEELAQLWYRTLLMLPSDADFETWSELMWSAAHSMGLSEAQILCVREALEQTEIKNSAIHTTMDFTVNPSFEFNIYDADGQLATDCNVIIRSLKDTLNTQLPLEAPISYDDGDLAYYQLELEEGQYIVTIVMNGYPETEETYAIEVKDGGTDELSIHMNQGKTIADISVHGILSGNEVSMPNSNVEVYRGESKELVYFGGLSGDNENIRFYLEPDFYTIVASAPGYVSQQCILEMWDTFQHYNYSFVLETTDETLSDILPMAPEEITDGALYDLVKWEYTHTGTIEDMTWTKKDLFEYIMLNGDDPVYETINRDLYSIYDLMGKESNDDFEGSWDAGQTEVEVEFVYPSPKVLHNGNGIISFLISPEQAVTYSLYNGAQLGLHILSGEFDELYLHRIQQVVLNSGLWENGEQEIYSLDLNDFAFVVMNGEIMILGIGSPGRTVFTPFEWMLHTGLYVNQESIDRLEGTLRLTKSAGSATYDMQVWDQSFSRLGAPGCVQWMGYVCEYPILSGTSGCNQINEVLYNLAKQFMNGIPDELTQTSNRFEYNIWCNDHCDDEDFSFKYRDYAGVVYNDNGILSYVMNWSVNLQHYKNGQHYIGSQMYDGLHGMVFDLETGQQISLEQITGMDQQTLMRMILDAYGRVYTDASLKNLKYDPATFDLNNGAYILTKDGQIVLYFTATESFSESQLESMPMLAHEYEVVFNTGLYVQVYE